MFAFRLRRGALLLTGLASLANCERSAPVLTHRFEAGCTQRYRMVSNGDSWEFSVEPASVDASLAQVSWWPSEDPSATRRRSLDLSPTRVGPAAPDAACRDRLHDPFEDFVALTFVRFDAQAARWSWLGEAIAGDGSTCASPGSCCAPLACNPMSENEPSRSASAAACQLGRWREQRLSEPETTGPIELRSSWKNGQNGPRSTHATRSVDFDADAGRTLRSRVKIEFGDERPTRDIEIVALDRCNGIQPLAGD